MDGKTKKITKKILLYVLLIILALIWIVPIFTLVATALKHKKDFMSGLSLFQLPAEIAWDNFTNAITKGNLFTYMKNDLIISCLKVPLGIFVGAMASFALTRLNIKHRIGIFVFFLIGMMLPMQTALVPINIIYSKLNLLNTYFGLFYVYIGFGISYCILIMRGFMLGIPKDIDEAACIDGCNKWQLFYKIILPIAKPAIATLFITDFLSTWNEYLLASVIINFIALGLYAKVAVGAMGGVAGLKAVIISYGAVGLIATIALVFLLPDPEKAGKGQDGGDSGQETKLSMKEWAGVFKDPRTWFAGIAVFATYSTYQTLSYFTPYFTNVLGATVVGSGAIAIIRTYGIRIVGAPLGGYMGDRIHSVSSVIATVLACGAVITLIFMFMPAGVPSVLLTVMTLVIGFMVHIARGAMFAVPSEVKIPRRYAASTAGVVCAIGFCPDLFQAAMYGHWLDTCGNAGYTRIFIYIIAIMVVGVINGVATVVYKKKYVAAGLVPVEGGTEAAQAQ